MNLDLVPLVLARALGSEWSSSTSRLRTHQRDYAVVAVDQANESVVVKLVGPDAPHWVSTASLDRAPYFARRMRKIDLPVPEVLAVDTTCLDVPVRYAVFRALPGIPLVTVLGKLSPPELAPVFTQLGVAVGRMHELDFPAFGELDATGSVVDGVPDYASALARRATLRLINPDHRNLFHDLVDRHRANLRNAGPPALTHEDLNPTNLLVEQTHKGWHLSGVLDWDAAWAGCPESDLARLGAWRGMHPPAFWKAYQSVRRVAEGFELRQPLLALLWCLEYARPTAAHHADTSRVCAALGIPPIRFT